MEDVKTFNGIKSTKIPRYELIPREALVAFARIFEEGIRKKGEEGAWNGLRDKYLDLITREFAIDRMGHAIDHASKALQKLARGEMPDEFDAGALMFAGAVLASYQEKRQRAQLGKAAQKAAEEVANFGDLFRKIEEGYSKPLFPAKFNRAEVFHSLPHMRPPPPITYGINGEWERGVDPWHVSHAPEDLQHLEDWNRGPIMDGWLLKDAHGAIRAFLPFYREIVFCDGRFTTGGVIPTEAR